MFFALATFIISGILLSLTLVLKYIQERAGLLIFWPHARNKVEINLVQKRNAFYAFVHRLTHHDIYVFIHFILRKAGKMTGRIQKRLDSKAHQVMEIVSGQGSLRMRENATAFLQDITRFNKQKK